MLIGMCLFETYPIKVDFRELYTFETFSSLPSILISPMDPTLLIGLLGSSPSEAPLSFIACGGMFQLVCFDSFK